VTRAPAASRPESQQEQQEKKKKVLDKRLMQPGLPFTFSLMGQCCCFWVYRVYDVYAVAVSSLADPGRTRIVI
jgi:hypothetical protein